jgi:hypothetical protein
MSDTFGQGGNQQPPGRNYRAPGEFGRGGNTPPPNPPVFRPAPRQASPGYIEAPLPSRGMKTLIVVEMLILWAGTIGNYKDKFPNADGTGTDWPEAITQVGLRSAIPTAILAFWLLLVADLGGGKIAALFGGIVTFSYLTKSVKAVTDLMDGILAMQIEPTVKETATDNPGALGAGSDSSKGSSDATKPTGSGNLPVIIK